MTLLGSKPKPAAVALLRLPPMSSVTPLVMSVAGALLSVVELPAEEASLVVDEPLEDAALLLVSVDPI